jgi:acetyl esterase/lipase
MTRDPIRDIVYVDHAGRPLKLDLYLPGDPDLPCPVVVWISGHGWRDGGKDSFREHWFLESGMAVAAIDYRLSPAHPFPAAIEDLQTAVCWLRAHAAEYRIDPDRIGLWGCSGGGHLAALLGTSAAEKNWTVPEPLAAQPRAVQAVCDVSGPTLLPRMAEPALKAKYASLYEMTSAFLGGPVEEQMAVAKEASPVTYVHAGCPPFLIFHGTADQVVPFSEGVLLHKALIRVGADVGFHAVREAGHTYEQADIEEMHREICEFFVRVLKPVSGGSRCTSFSSPEG